MATDTIKKVFISDIKLHENPTREEIFEHLINQIRGLASDITAVSFAEIKFSNLSTEQIIQMLNELPQNIKYVELWITADNSLYPEDFEEYEFFKGKEPQEKLRILDSLENKTIVAADDHAYEKIYQEEDNEETEQENNDDFEVRDDQIKITVSSLKQTLERFPKEENLSILLRIIDSHNNCEDAILTISDILEYFKASSYYRDYLVAMVANYSKFIETEHDDNKNIHMIIAITDLAIDSDDSTFKEIIFTNKKVLSFILSNYTYLIAILGNNVFTSIIMHSLIENISDLNELFIFYLILEHPNYGYLIPTFNQALENFNRKDIFDKISEFNSIPSIQLNLPQDDSQSSEEIFTSLCDELKKIPPAAKCISLSNVRFRSLTTEQIIQAFEIIASKFILKIEFFSPTKETYKEDDGKFNIFIQRYRQDIQFIFDILPKHMIVSITGHSPIHTLTAPVDVLVIHSNKIVTEIDFLYVRDIFLSICTQYTALNWAVFVYKSYDHPDKETCLKAFTRAVMSYSELSPRISKSQPFDKYNLSNYGIRQLLELALEKADIPALGIIFRNNLAVRYILAGNTLHYLNRIFDIDINMDLLLYLLSYQKIRQSLFEQDTDRTLIVKIQVMAEKLSHFELSSYLSYEDATIKRKDELEEESQRSSLLAPTRKLSFRSHHIATKPEDWTYLADSSGKIITAQITTHEEDLGGNKGQCIKAKYA